MQLNLFQNNSGDSKDVWQVYTDGASRSNPGPSGAGIYILKNGKSFLKKAYYLNKKTNNEAEYMALLLAIILLKDHYKDGDKLEIFADSQLLIMQLKGSYKVTKDHLRKLKNAIISILYEFDYNLNHILRDKNTVADKLSNEAIDKKIQIDDSILAKLTEHEIHI